MTTSVAQAWQQALAAEHAAVFGYGVLGPHLTDATQTALGRSSERDHRALRDRTISRLLAAGQSPVAPQADYPLPFPVTGVPNAQRLALRLEEAATSAWRYVIAVAADTRAPRAGLGAATVRTVRADAQNALTAGAVRATRWRRMVTPAAPTVPFPGI